MASYATFLSALLPIVIWSAITFYRHSKGHQRPQKRLWKNTMEKKETDTHWVTWVRFVQIVVWKQRRAWRERWNRDDLTTFLIVLRQQTVAPILTTTKNDEKFNKQKVSGKVNIKYPLISSLRGPGHWLYSPSESLFKLLCTNWLLWFFGWPATRRSQLNIIVKYISNAAWMPHIVKLSYWCESARVPLNQLNETVWSLWSANILRMQTKYCFRLSTDYFYGFNLSMICRMVWPNASDESHTHASANIVFIQFYNFQFVICSWWFVLVRIHYQLLSPTFTRFHRPMMMRRGVCTVRCARHEDMRCRIVLSWQRRLSCIYDGFVSTVAELAADSCCASDWIILIVDLFSAIYLPLEEPKQVRECIFIYTLCLYILYFATIIVKSISRGTCDERPKYNSLENRMLAENNVVRE